MRSEHGSHLPLACDAVLSLCWEVGLEMERRKPELVMSSVPPILSGCHHPARSERRSRGAGVEALRVRFELILFTLGVHSPLSWQQYFYPRGELCWSWKGLIGCLVWARAGTGMVLAQQSEFQGASNHCRQEHQQRLPSPGSDEVLGPAGPVPLICAVSLARQQSHCPTRELFQI